MDALVQSFVAKVHLHVTGQDGCADAVVHHLVPVLTPGAPPDAVCKVLATICHNLNRNVPAIRAHQAVERLLEYMIATDPSTLPIEAVHNACTVLTFAEDTAVVALMRAHRGDPARYATIVSGLVGWHLLSGSNTHVFMFAFFLTLHRETLREFRKTDPVAMLHQRLTPDVLQNVSSAVLALKTFLRLVRGAEDAFVEFWQHDGLVLLNAVVARRDEVPRGQFLAVLADLVAERPATASLDLPADDLVAPLLARDLVHDPELASNVELYHNDALAAPRRAVAGDVHLHGASSASLELTERDLEAALRFVVLVGRQRRRRTRAGSPSCPTRRRARCARPPRPPACRRRTSCPTLRRCCASAPPLRSSTSSSPGTSTRWRATAPPRGRLARTSRCTATCAAAPSSTWSTCSSARLRLRTRRASRGLRAHLAEAVERARRELEPTAGLERHCRSSRRARADAARRRLAALDALRPGGRRARRPPADAPITLETMHCPVVAPDGQTYELAAPTRARAAPRRPRARSRPRTAAPVGRVQRAPPGRRDGALALPPTRCCRRFRQRAYASRRAEDHFDIIRAEFL